MLPQDSAGSQKCVGRAEGSPGVGGSMGNPPVAGRSPGAGGLQGRTPEGQRGAPGVRGGGDPEWEGRVEDSYLSALKAECINCSKLKLVLPLINIYT